MWVKGRDTESRRRITPKPASPRPTSNNVAGSGTAATSPGPGHLPLLAQVIFYGALLAVIMSTWYGTLLAPSVTISESALKGWLTRRNLSDHKMLVLTRWVVACFAVCVTPYGRWARTPVFTK